MEKDNLDKVLEEISKPQEKSKKDFKSQNQVKKPIILKPINIPMETLVAPIVKEVNNNKIYFEVKNTFLPAVIVALGHTKTMIDARELIRSGKISVDNVVVKSYNCTDNRDSFELEINKTKFLIKKV